MKKMMFMAVLMVMSVSANAMSNRDARKEALFLSDRMAQELKLTNAQYDDVYEINLDYLRGVSGRSDAYGSGWNRRNNDLKYVLTAYQYVQYMKHNSFYRPLTWDKNGWSLNVYSHHRGVNDRKPDRTVAHNGNGSHSRGSNHSGARR